MTKEMLIDSFAYDGKRYIVDIYNNSIYFYIKNYDYIHGDSDDSSLTGNTKNPVKLLRKIEKSVRNYIYSKKLKYFMFYADNKKRVRLYKKFADSLVGYNYYIYNGAFYFNKITNFPY